MSNLQMIEHLCRMLDEALTVIREQAALLQMHGIETDDGTTEEKRRALLERVEREGWTP